MRVHGLLAIAVCGLYLGWATAAAQAQGAQVDVNPGGVRVETESKHAHEHATAMERIVRAKELTGLNVYNAENESLGEIQDLVIDPAAGKIRYAVLSFGGVMGIGDKLFAVPWHKLSFVPKESTRAGAPKEDYCILDVPKDALKSAPGFDKNNWPNFADANWRATIDRYYETRHEAAKERKIQR